LVDSEGVKRSIPHIGKSLWCVCCSMSCHTCVMLLCVLCDLQLCHRVLCFIYYRQLKRHYYNISDVFIIVVY